MINKCTYGAVILILAGSLAACSGGVNSGGTKGQLMSAIKKDKSAVVTAGTTLTIPKISADSLLEDMAQSNLDDYIVKNYLLLAKGLPPLGSFPQKMEADGYFTIKRYFITENIMGTSSFSENAGMGSREVYVYFLTKTGKKYFSKDTNPLDTNINNYIVDVKLYEEIPDHVVDYSVPSGNSGQSLVTANVDFRVAKAAPNDIFDLVKKIENQSGRKFPKIGSYIKHACEFTKMSDGYEFIGCQ